MGEVLDFQACIDACELIELPCGGYRYTWNDKHSDNIVFSKIDCVFVNKKWLYNMPVIRANYLVEGISDHCPLKITKAAGASKEKVAFKFSYIWEKHPQFKKIITQV